MAPSACLLDWDGTLREGLLILDWTRYLARKDKIPEHFVQAMEQSIAEHEAKDGIEYEVMAERVVRTYADSQKGLRKSDVDRLAMEFAESNLNVFPFAARLIDHLHQKGIEPIVITGSPTNVVELLAKKIGIHHCHGLELETDRAGVFVGSYEINLAVENSKRSLVAQLGTKFRDVRLALGNSGSDSPLLEVARCAYFITVSPGTASKFRQLEPLLREGKLKEISPEELLRRVEKDEVFFTANGKK